MPLLITQPSRHLLYATIACFAICGLSLIVLTGWAGQLSLGQMAFAGFGALVAAALTRGLALDLGVVNIDLAPMPFLLSILIAAFASAGLAALIGVGALRVRGLLLAVSTFAFSVAASQYLFRQPVLSDDLTTVPFPRGSLFGLDLSSQRTYYYVCLAVLVVAFVVVSRLRRVGHRPHHDRGARQRRPGGGVHGRGGVVEAPRVRDRRVHRRPRRRAARRRGRGGAVHRALLPGRRTRSRSSRWW